MQRATFKNACCVVSLPIFVLFPFLLFRKETVNLPTRLVLTAQRYLTVRLAIRDLL